MSQNINAAALIVTVINGVEFVNVTPHNIVVMNDKKEVLHTIPPSGVVARVAAKPVVIGSVAGIPVRKTSYGEIENLPEPQQGRYYIASVLLAQRAQREDVVIPDDAVRDDNTGQIIGCKALGLV